MQIDNSCIRFRIKPSDQIKSSIFNTKFDIFCVNPLTSSVKFGHQSFCLRVALWMGTLRENHSCYNTFVVDTKTKIDLIRRVETVTKGILMRNLTYIITFALLTAEVLKENFPLESFINNGID